MQIILFFEYVNSQITGLLGIQRYLLGKRFLLIFQTGPFLWSCLSSKRRNKKGYCPESQVKNTHWERIAQLKKNGFFTERQSKEQQRKNSVYWFTTQMLNNSQGRARIQPGPCNFILVCHQILPSRQTTLLWNSGFLNLTSLQEWDCTVRFL